MTLKYCHFTTDIGLEKHWKTPVTSDNSKDVFQLQPAFPGVQVVNNEKCLTKVKKECLDVQTGEGTVQHLKAYFFALHPKVILNGFSYSDWFTLTYCFIEKTILSFRVKGGRKKAVKWKVKCSLGEEK